MPIFVVNKDITKMNTNAIVTPVNILSEIVNGTEKIVYDNAEYNILVASNREFYKLEIGEATISSNNSSACRNIIYTVVPRWDAGIYDIDAKIRCCYYNSLKIAQENNCKTVAFPLIEDKTGGISKEKAFNIAIETIKRFIVDFAYLGDMAIYIIVDDKFSYISPLILESIDDYVSKNYVDSVMGQSDYYEQHILDKNINNYVSYKVSADKKTWEKPKFFGSIELDLNDMTKTLTFSEKIREIMKSKNLTDPIVYARANMQRQTFNRIINDRNAIPRKRTVLAIAIGLELDIEETKDLICRAGYAFSKCSKLDIIVEGCIKARMYNLIDINVLLDRYEQPCLP